jgi:hypothetical protein
VVHALGEPDHRERDRDALLRSALPSLVRSSGSSTFRAAVSTGSRLYNWNTKPDVARAPRRQLAARQLVDAVARDRDRPFGRRVEPADQVQQRRLADPEGPISDR